MTKRAENVITKLQQFLQRLQQGEFTEELEAAFRQLNSFLTTYEAARLYLSRSYFQELYAEGRRGQQHLFFVAARTLDDHIPQVAQVVAEGLINLCVQHEDEEFLHILFEIILKYKLDKFMSIESGKIFRVEVQDRRFSVTITSIRAKLRLDLLRLVLRKYVNLLVHDPLPESQDLPSVIQRLNAIMLLLQTFQPSEELIHHPAFLPFTFDHFRYTPDHAALLFGQDLTALEYDERLFTNYKIPLFPLIEPDKLSFIKNKVTFTNEGLGCLPSSLIRIQISEEEFELGEIMQCVVPDEVYDLFLARIPEFLEFLRKQKPNLDVKVIFSFRKFGKPYHFAILAKSVGHWLEQIPSLSFDLAKPYDIPIEKLDEKDFEKLCEWIAAEDSQKRFADVSRLNADGGGERGRDVLATEVSTGKKYVFQCKRVKKFDAKDIEKELTKFSKYIAQDSTIKPDVYVVFMSTPLTDKTQAKGNELAQRIGMEIKYWDKSTIDRLVRTNSIVKERFWKLLDS